MTDYGDDPILKITIWVTAIATGLLLAVLEIAPRVGPPPRWTTPNPGPPRLGVVERNGAHGPATDAAAHNVASVAGLQPTARRALP